MTLETLTQEQVDENEDQFLDLVAQGNDRSFNLTKLAEELAELSEVVLKMNNKAPDKAPSPELFIEEAGDVSIRIVLAGKMLFPEGTEFEDKLFARMDYKMQKMVDNVLAKKYLNKV